MLATFACLACARTTAPPQATPQRVYTEFNRLATDSLWPGFDPRAIAVAVYDGSDTWLFGHGAPPAEFHQTSDSLAATYSGRHPIVTVNTSTVLAGEPTAAVLLRFDIDDDPTSWAGVAIHESFHVFQQQNHPTWRPNEIDLFRYPRDDAGLLTTRRLETEALRRALAAEGAEWQCWAQRALTYRAQRFSRLDSASARYERESERLEGLADYVELSATGSTALMPSSGYRPEDIRVRTYATGTALGVLLDRSDPSWKESIETGDDRYLDEMLAVALAQACHDTSDTIDVDSVAHAAAQAIDSLASRMAQLRQAFNSQAGWTLTVIADQDPFVPAAFDPLNVDLLGGTEVLHRRFVRLENTGGWLELYDRASITVGRVEHPLFAGIVEVRVAGLSARPSLARDGGMVTITGQGVEARLPDAEVNWGDRSVRVRVK